MPRGDVGIAGEVTVDLPTECIGLDHDFEGARVKSFLMKNPLHDDRATVSDDDFFEEAP